MPTRNSVMALAGKRLGDLPDELLEMILSHLEEGSVVVEKLHQEPYTVFRNSECQPLKRFSRTCHRFRSFTVRSLFEFCRVNLTALSFNEPYEMSECSHKPKFSEMEDFLRFVTGQKLSSCVKSLVLYTEEDLGHKVPGLMPQPPHNSIKFELGDFWPTVFSSIRPECVTICAPPPTLSFFTSCGIYVGDAWAFSTMFHLLHLRMPSNMQASDYTPRSGTTKLFEILPWDHCTLNEGSSLQVYNTYEYHSMVAPSIFDGQLRDTPSAPPRQLTSLTTFDYIAIFPLYGQVAKILSFLFMLPKLQRVKTQLAPRRENRILEDTSRVLRSLYSDLWSEFETTYFLIATTIVQAEKRSSIKDFVCLDYQREGLWESLGHGGEIMSQHWRTLGNGHWEKLDLLEPAWISFVSSSKLSLDKLAYLPRVIILKFGIHLRFQ